MKTINIIKFIESGPEMGRSLPETIQVEGLLLRDIVKAVWGAVHEDVLCELYVQRHSDFYSIYYVDLPCILYYKESYFTVSNLEEMYEYEHVA